MAPIRLGPAKVGLLVPLSGPGAALGEDLLDAAQLALFDVGRTDLELLPRDTGDQPQKAEAAARSALDAGAELLLGPALRPLGAWPWPRSRPAPGRQRDLVLQRRQRGAAGALRPGLPPRGADRAHRRATRRRRGAPASPPWHPSDAYGARGARRVAGGRGAGAGRDRRDRRDLSARQRQPDGRGAAGGGVRPPGRSAARASRRRTRHIRRRAEPPPVLPPPGFDARADRRRRPARHLDRGAARLLRHRARATWPLLGTMRWQDDPALLADAGLQGALAGDLAAGRELAEFERRFAEVYGRSPAPLAVLAYDATALAVLLAQGSRGSPRPSSPTRRALSAAPGSSGFGPNGLADHGLAVVEVEAGAERVLDPAPTSFTRGYAQPVIAARIAVHQPIVYNHVDCTLLHVATANEVAIRAHERRRTPIRAMVAWPRLRLRQASRSSMARPWCRSRSLRAGSPAGGVDGPERPRLQVRPRGSCSSTRRGGRAPRP